MRPYRIFRFQNLSRGTSVVLAAACFLCTVSRSFAPVVPVQTKAQSAPTLPAEELFQKAKAIYSDERLQPLEDGKNYLLKAGDSGHELALYNIFLGYHHGYLGGIDIPKATDYRARWLTARGRARDIYQLAMGHLGEWQEVPPKGFKDVEGFIFTGERVQKLDESWKRSFVGTQVSRQISNGKTAVDMFERALAKAFNNKDAWGKDDRDTVIDSMEKLSMMVLNEPFAIRTDPSNVAYSQSAMGYKTPTSLPAFVLGAPSRGVSVTEKAKKAAARVLKQVGSKGLFLPK